MTAGVAAPRETDPNQRSVSVRVDSKIYPAAHGVSGNERVLDGVRFEIAPAEFVALIGPSGCGKSTLLQIVAGLDDDFSGSIAWPSAQRRRLGYVFQQPRLLPWLTLRNNLRLVLNCSASAKARIDELLDAMDLSAFADYHPNRISVGMQRRVALARAFAVEPDLLLMDEPFVSLDLPTANLLRALLLRVWDKYRSRVLFVTHDLFEATQLADRILFLSATPARILDEAEVGIPRAARTDAKVVEARYRALRERFDDLYGATVGLVPLAGQDRSR